MGKAGAKLSRSALDWLFDIFAPGHEREENPQPDGLKGKAL